MITPDPQDDTSPVKRRGLKLDPLNADTPAASVSIGSSSATPEELKALRDQVMELSLSIGHDEEPKEVLVLPQQQSAPHTEHTDVQESTPIHSGAANLIRTKLAKLYAKEPDAGEEVIESYQEQNRSKHQQYMYNLTNSGRGLADIQTQWHAYYTALPDAEKHEVWQEFYSAHEHAQRIPRTFTDSNLAMQKSPSTAKKSKNQSDTRTVAEIKKQVLMHAGAGKKASIKQHIQSIIFGLGMASLVVVFLLFGFFNERFIAPFVSPSRQVTATPIIGNDVKVGPEPKVLISKINLEIPVVYGVNSTDEKAIQNSLESGVVHYSTSPTPGQTGNVVIVGHSSNNIFNKGKYKFAFVLLKRLEIGDTFSLNKDGVRYITRYLTKKS